MKSHAYYCENCGASLVEQNAVCVACESEFVAANVDHQSGIYLCPACNCRFDKALAGLWPPTAKWYMPQGFKSQCPHCAVFLRDRKNIERKPWEFWVNLFIYIVALYLSWQHETKFLSIALLVIWIVLDIARWWHAKSSVKNEENRYAVARL